MKVVYEQISQNLESSILYRKFSNPRIDAPFHYHPEIELTFMEESHGRRFVGSQINDFFPGDLVLIGENVPHTWIDSIGGNSYVIQFKKDIIVWDLPEISSIKQLIEKAQAGISIKGKTKEKIIKKINMDSMNPFERLINVIEILQILAHSEELELIDTNFSNYELSSSDNERFKKIYGHIIKNYQEEIDLNTIAAIANLTPTAFCRYFKKITRKTLIEVVSEFRIKHACQLLTTTEKSVYEICFESGFGNLSYFNKEFKKKMGLSPLKYKNMFT